MTGEIDQTIALEVQQGFKLAMKRARDALRRGNADFALDHVQHFFDQKELLAQYFHPQSVEAVQNEMEEQMEEAKGILAPILAENPVLVKEFVKSLQILTKAEFDAFQEMKLSTD